MFEKENIERISRISGDRMVGSELSGLWGAAKRTLERIQERVLKRGSALPRWPNNQEKLFEAFESMKRQIKTRIF